ncbi:hypothetical protein [Lactobacillus psittaci]|uniref:Uncharacterized protein n=1 Tax=Lactobacillus psittaci DSM 15354 TaxID=1122152 RepID=A0A0R1S3N1_9LACO|nr:hypothetical protein [Lactobacillus psittaci]KRL63537.1 hypothetical protein FC23_GL000780 [Lactobacillus psittaci DSM 15354]
MLQTLAKFSVSPEFYLLFLTVLEFTSKPVELGKKFFPFVFDLAILVDFLWLFVKSPLVKDVALGLSLLVFLWWFVNTYKAHKALTLVLGSVGVILLALDNFMQSVKTYQGISGTIDLICDALVIIMLILIIMLEMYRKYYWDEEPDVRVEIEANKDGEELTAEEAEELKDRVAKQLKDTLTNVEDADSTEINIKVNNVEVFHYND